MNSLTELCDFMEKFLKSIIRDFVDKHQKEIFAYREILSLPPLNWGELIDEPYKRMTYDDACSFLKQYDHKFESPVDACKHLTKEHETFLVENNGNVPIFITEWPPEKKPFYVKISPTNSKVMT